MTFLHPRRYRLGVVAAVAILTACGGSQSSSGAALPQSASVPLSPAASRLGTYVKPAAGSIQDIYSFLGSPDGNEPRSGVDVYQGPNSNAGLIGTTLLGGDANNDGTVYGLTKGKKGAWTESVLHTFGGSASGDGSEPTGITTIIERTEQAPDAIVATVGGGTSNNGALVELIPTSSGPWTESFIYSFGGTPDGANPYGDPLVDKQGNIYGTTYAGGNSGAGTVYRMSPKGPSYIETILYSFQSGNDGEGPRAGVVADKKGELYGTTEGGGTGSNGTGTVFKLTASGSTYTESILHSFQGVPDGSGPTAGVCSVPNGSLYGTTEKGGTQNLGTVYKLTPSGKSYKESVLWSFGIASGDGAYPYGGVVVDKKGVIYGTTLEGGSGGSSGPGTFFTLTPSSGTYKESIYNFTGTNGEYPYAGPSVDSKGNICVTTGAGGAKGKGTVGAIKGTKKVAFCT
jgi:uncharacterized repeat protein (TIGR03803 family)